VLVTVFTVVAAAFILPCEETEDELSGGVLQYGLDILGFGICHVIFGAISWIFSLLETSVTVLSD